MELEARLVSMEGELLAQQVRSDPARLAELLHADFTEVGRSGRSWTRADVLASMPSDDPPAITMRDARVELIAPGVALVLYVSHDAATGRLTQRSSLWLREGGRDWSGGVWKMRFHQGTDL